MKILLIHRHFFPDTPPYALMLMSIGNSLLESGHEVHVLTTQPSYKSTSVQAERTEKLASGLYVKRMGLFFDKKKTLIFKLINMLLFPLRVFIYLLLNRSYDIVTVSTAPPVLAGYAVALGCKLSRTKFIYHCMDIHPEIGRLSGEFGNKYIFHLLVMMDNWTCQRASKVVVLSTDMKKSLLARKNLDFQNVDIQVINNFSLPDSLVADKKEYFSHLKMPGIFRVIFAGNIGRFQGLDSFVESVKHLEKFGEIDDFELVFVGEGRALNELKELSSKFPCGIVKFIPHMSVSSIKKLISNADLAIVSLSSDIIRYAYPSKTMTYLEQGCPILVAVEQDSELAEFVIEENIGFSVPPGDIYGIATIIANAKKETEQMLLRKKNAKEVSKLYFSEKVILKNWKILIAELNY